MARRLVRVEVERRVDHDDGGLDHERDGDRWGAAVGWDGVGRGGERDGRGEGGEGGVWSVVGPGAAGGMEDGGGMGQ